MLECHGMAAEHVQLLASLAVGQLPHDQLDDALSVEMGGVTHKQLPSQDLETKDSDLDKIDSGSQPNIPTVIYGNLRKKRKAGPDDSGRHTDFKILPTKERSSSSKIEMRRPVRPIDRQKMRPWLKNLLDKGSVFGLNWLKREEGIFQISWRHASRLGWNLETDGDVFERWARHTGIFKDGDTPEPKRWKANFRCALHSLPDVKELTSPDDRKGRNASRTYRFLTATEVQPPVKRKHRYTVHLPYLYEQQNSEDSGSQNADSDDRNSDEETSDGQSRQVPHCDHDYAARTGKNQAEAGGLTTSAIFQRHGSGYVLIKSKDAHEYEFRLTSNEGEVDTNQQLSPQKSSPQRKSPVRRKKPAAKSALSAVGSAKKGKGKDSTKGILKQKGGKKLGNKKKKAAVERAGPPRSKPPPVTLQALLAGRQVNRSSKRPRTSRAAGGVTRKPRSRKASSSTAKSSTSKGGEDSGAGTPTQRQGLDACMLLLEAATQLDRMDSLSKSGTSTTSTKTVSTSRNPPKSSAPPRKTSNTSSARTPPTDPVPAVVSSAPVTPGTVFQVPQNSPSMLHQYLGLSAVTSASKTPALSSLLSVANQATTSAGAVPASSFVSPFKVVGIVGNIESGFGVVAPPLQAVSKEEVSAVSDVAPVLTQSLGVPLPGQQGSTASAGTSMLKHLLKLTCPPPPRHTLGSVAVVASQTANPVSTPVSMRPLTSPPVTMSTVSSETSNAVAALVKEERKSPPVEDTIESDTQDEASSYKVVAEYELGPSQEETWAEKGEKNFPYLRVSTSKVFVKPEPGSLEMESATVVDAHAGAQVEHGAGVSFVECTAQPGTSMDSIMQFLSLCAANGSSQVVFKTETSVPDDVIAINSAYTPVKSDPDGVQQQSNSADAVNQISLVLGHNLEGGSGLQHQVISVKSENTGEDSTLLPGFGCTHTDQTNIGASENSGIGLNLNIPTSDGEIVLLPKEEPAESPPQGLV